MAWYDFLRLIALLMKITTLYYAVLLLRYGMKTAPIWPAAAPETRFAVVIAARNEEAVIERIIHSLQAQNYPKELFDIYVAPNNCTDHTAEAAFRAGAKLLLCDHAVKNKGDALRQAFCQLSGMHYDAYLVFDADNVVDQNYLCKTNHAFHSGARVVKGRQMVLNPKDSWIAGCYDIYFSLFDLLYNRPRAKGGLSAKLIGTGFAVHDAVLKQLNGWNTETIAEDAEFAAMCAEKGIRVCWAPEAITYDEAPEQFSVSLHQRKRWCSGVIQVGRKMLPLLAQSEGKLVLDMCVFLLTAQLQPISSLMLAAAEFGALIFNGLNLKSILQTLLFSLSACLGLAAAVQQIERPKTRRNWHSVLLFPVFMVSWIPVQILGFFHKTTAWREIRHGGKCTES